MPEMNIGAGLGAVAFWGFVAAVVVAGIWLDVRKRESQHETLRRIIESGQPIDEAFMDKILALNGSGDHLHRNLKVGGLIIIFVSFGMVVLSFALGERNSDHLLPLLGVSGLIGFIGIGLLVASKFACVEEDKNRISDHSYKH